MSQERNVVAHIDAAIGDKANKELKILSIRQGRNVRDIAGELLDSLFEEMVETPSFKFADMQTLQQQVKSLESQMEKLSAQLEMISKLPALNPPEPNAESREGEFDSVLEEDDLSAEATSEKEPAVQEALGEDEAPSFVPEY